LEDVVVVSVDIVIPPPTTKGRVFVEFAPSPLDEAAERSRREASRERPPDEDPFSMLFYILLAKANWDVRVKGLDSLLAAYPAGKRPYPFQLEGIEFLAKRSRALLADEMGLGKTVQAILALRACIHAGRMERVLVVCPKSLLANWYYEFCLWAPELSVTIAHGADKFIRIHRAHHVYITNYDSVERVVVEEWKGLGRRRLRPFDLLVIDEVQNLKNSATRRARAIAEVPAETRWALTGTPLENSFAEYRGVWRAIDPNSSRGNLPDDQLLRNTKQFVLRREKSQVLRDLPEKSVTVQYVELDGKQLERYVELEEQAKRDVSRHIGSGLTEKLRMEILALLNKLKQMCVVDPRSGESAKMEWIEERLEEMHPSGVLRERCEKALIFSQYPRLVWDEWKLQRRVSSFNPIRYDASLRDEQRNVFPQQFQNDEAVRVAFMGLKAGGIGLTLTRANQVIFLDHWWNPAVMEQAAARVHRIGQSRRCVITSLVAKDTIDERIMDILADKRELFERVMREVQQGRRSPADLENLAEALTIDDMLRALGMQRETRQA
jgi:SNF2 family DNA or RNA helicase